MYEQLLGRKPIGLTADAGYQIGVRRTVRASKETIWRYLTSGEGLKLWLGTIAPFPIAVGSAFVSEEGVSGKFGVVKSPEKLRMKWQRKDWENASTLQIYLLSSGAGKTTVAFHQEKLDDLYMREIMKRHWELAAETLLRELTAQEA
ncbi:SRPBCC domain-containing protein [Paenibacillus sp. IB182493]|uniref:SRPBCC domain-containing protein n=2 Tax=Paenibacillus arenilitoris TaxID=2772299 RepID=A0A927CPK1_9BACL|nr:SRPBCC domain-containing protein [Paenibacillus arenilitoris]